MKPPKEIPGSAKEWLSHAQSDLALAKLASGDQNILASQVCFHAQQSAEKAIKAVLRFHQIDFPFTHDLDALLEVAGQSKILIPPNVQDAGRLTPYAVEARYPGAASPIEADVQSSIQLAQAILDWATPIIK